MRVIDPRQSEMVPKVSKTIALTRVCRALDAMIFSVAE